VRHIRALFKEHLSSIASAGEEKVQIEVNSVDGFQGREKDIILLSCVRSDRNQTHRKGIGFLKDERRMNVSVTRARCSVFVLGHAATLEKHDPLWQSALEDAKERKCLVRAHSPIGIWFDTARKERASILMEVDGDDETMRSSAEAASTVVVQRAAQVDSGAVSSPRGSRAKKAVGRAKAKD